jgi:hypothetical protein
MPDPHLLDSLDDSDGATVLAHTPGGPGATGGAYGVASGLSNTLVFGGNRVHQATDDYPGYGLVENAAVPSSPNQYVQLQILPATNAGQQILFKFRTYHYVFYDFGNSQWGLLVIGLGELGRTTDAGRFVDGTQYTVRVEESGNTITAKVDGATAWTYAVTGASIDVSTGKNGFGFKGGNGPDTGVQVLSSEAGTAISLATAYAITGASVVAAGVPSQADASSRGYAGGPMALELTPAGSVLDADFTATLSDGASGAFSPTTVTIQAGSGVAYFRYTASGVGARSIVAAETSGHGFGARTAVVQSVGDVVACLGDSRTDSVGGAPGGSAMWPARLQSWIGATAAVLNFASAGTGAEAIPDQKAAGLDPIAGLNPPGRKIAVVWTLRNSFDVLGDTTGEGYGAYSAGCAAVKAAGWTVIAATEIHSVGSVGINPRIDEANQMIRVHWREFADALVQLDADNRLDAADGATSAGNFSDGVHLTAAGEIIVGGLMESMVLAALRGWLAVVIRVGAPRIGGGRFR